VVRVSLKQAVAAGGDGARQRALARREDAGLREVRRVVGAVLQ
jgi:hypothetical protein